MKLEYDSKLSHIMTESTLNDSQRLESFEHRGRELKKEV